MVLQVLSFLCTMSGLLNLFDTNLVSADIFLNQLLKSNSFLKTFLCSMKTELPVHQLRSDSITVCHLAGS